MQMVSSTAPLIVWEMQVRTTVRYHCTAARTTVNKKNTNVDKIVLKRNYCARLMGYKLVQPLWETGLQISQNTKNRSTTSVPSCFSSSDSLWPRGYSCQASLSWDSPARILEWVAIPSSRGSSRPKDQTRVSYASGIGRQVLYYWRYQGSPRTK